MTSEIKNKVKTIANHNGYGIVKMKLNEELIELIKALKFNDEDSIIEEASDVFIMLSELIEIYGEERFRQIIGFKLDRTMNRLGLK